MAERTGRPRASLVDLITTGGLVLGLLYGGIELRQLRQTREAEAVLELMRTVQTPAYTNAINVLITMPDSLTVEQVRSVRYGEHRNDLLHLLLIWESLGILVYRGDVPIEWVDEFYRFAVLTSWRKFGPLMEDERVRSGYRGRGEWFQWLAERLQEREPDAKVPAYERYRNWKSK